MFSGFTGKVLHVDLSLSRIDVEKPPEIFYRRYFGGRGFVAYYLLTRMKPGTDPLGPDNVLVLASSVLGGAPSHGLCRFSIGAKSPLTGGFGESEAGGFWGPELKFAGFDAVVIKGRAAKPVYLWVHEGLAEIRDGSALWGKTTGDTQDGLKGELGDDRVRVLAIGPAGENLVPYANVANDLTHMSGRTGMGAVMGSKMLKAVVCRGVRKAVSVHDPKGVGAIAKRVARDRKSNPLSDGLNRLGTPGALLHLNRLGALPTRNFREGQFEKAENLSGERMMETRLERREGCYSCAIQCRARVRAGDERFAVESRYGRPEYETLASLGTNLGVDDLDAVIKGNELCNKLGLDCISMGVSIAFAMDCSEHGLLPEGWGEGLDLRFGNAGVMLRLIEDTAYRRGVGARLAKGVRAMAQEIGPDAEKLAVHTKGQEAPLHDGRGKAGVGFGYAVIEKGADHLSAGFDQVYENPENPGFLAVAPLGILETVDALDMGPRKVRLFAYMSSLWSFYNCASICNFAFAPRSITTLGELVDLVRAVTGWDTSLWEIMKVGERAINMARAYNVREGFSRKDDQLPERFFQPLEGQGPLKGYRLDREEFEKALDLYYGIMNWDPQKARPTYAKLVELDIDWVWALISH